MSLNAARLPKMDSFRWCATAMTAKLCPVAIVRSQIATTTFPARQVRIVRLLRTYMTATEEDSSPALAWQAAIPTPIALAPTIVATTQRMTAPRNAGISVRDRQATAMIARPAPNVRWERERSVTRAAPVQADAPRCVTTIPRHARAAMGARQYLIGARLSASMMRTAPS